MRRILVIEDNQDIAAVLNKKLRELGWDVTILRDGWQVVSFLLKRERSPDILVLDMMLPGRSGLELFSTIKSVWPAVKIFIFSAHRQYSSQIPREDIRGFVLKTEGVDKLISEIQNQCDESEVGDKSG